MFSLSDHSHRRYNPMTDQWVLVSPHRTKRPWQGQVDPVMPDMRPAYDPTCYLCPGNARAGGVRNPQYTTTFVFDNDFAALLPDVPAGGVEEGRGGPVLLRADAARGICRVACFSPRHDLSVPQLSVLELRLVVDSWVEQVAELSALDTVAYVQIFENRGAMMGASNPHPHCQIWGAGYVPNELVREQEMQARYFAETARTLLSDYLALELERDERVVCANEHFVALVPYWAQWPFETMLISRRAQPSLLMLADVERDGLADILKQLTLRYDALFEAPFPYSMGFHQAPADGAEHPEWHLHAHYYPPLLRSATVRKFFVGFEMLGEPQRDITPEQAAQRLRAL
jgi:UDPglucose--hexose-1-phosphate uridylyltransferase